MLAKKVLEKSRNGSMSPPEKDRGEKRLEEERAKLESADECDIEAGGRARTGQRCPTCGWTKIVEKKKRKYVDLTDGTWNTFS